MVKTPRTRHSKTKREPVTIDLEADAVGRERPRTDPPREEPAETSGGQASGTTESQSVTEETEATANTTQAEADAETGFADAAPEDSASGETTSPAMGPADGAEPRKRVGYGTAFAAGMMGGIVTLAVAGGLIWTNVLPLPEEGNGEVETLRQELDATRNELAELRDAAPSGSSDEAVEQALAAPRQEIQELRESVDALQSAMRSNGNGAALQEQISELESRVASLAEDGGGMVSPELEQRISDVESGLEGAVQSADAARQSAMANAEQLEELAAQLTQVSNEVASRDEGPRLALIVAASALRSAVERGEPFARELETYAAVASDASALEPLRPYAETGIPTQAELAREVSEIASRIAASGSELPPDADFFDRLMASARSAVNIRPVGEAEGDTPGAIAARVEAAVQRGDYTRALAEYEALPPAAKDAAADFAEKLRARQTAEDVLDEALSSALQPA